MRNFLDNRNALVIFTNDSCGAKSAARVGPLHTFCLTRLFASVDGPYLVVPIIGPSEPRDAIGMAVDSDPFYSVAYDNGSSNASPCRWIASGIDERSRDVELRRDPEECDRPLRAAAQSAAPAPRHGEPAPPEDENLYTDPALNNE
jgi:hypothetical protein